MNQWTGFLPSHALIMARQTRVPSEVPTPKEIGILFLSEHPLTAPEATLLQKMQDALELNFGIQKSDMEVVSLPSLSENPTLQYRARVMVALGKVSSGSNIEVGSLFQTHSLAELLSNPAFKKPAWEQLQAAARKLKGAR